MLAANVRGLAMRAAFQYAFPSVHAARVRSERKAAVVDPEGQAKRRVFEPLLFHLTAIAICSWARQVFFLMSRKRKRYTHCTRSKWRPIFPVA